MSHKKAFLLATKILAICIVIAYGVGLFKSYDILQAVALLIVAVLIGIDLVFLSQQTIRK
jgi:hypothetical protein